MNFELSSTMISIDAASSYGGNQAISIAAIVIPSFPLTWGGPSLSVRRVKDNRRRHHQAQFHIVPIWPTSFSSTTMMLLLQALLCPMDIGPQKKNRFLCLVVERSPLSMDSNSFRMTAIV